MFELYTDIDTNKIPGGAAGIKIGRTIYLENCINYIFPENVQYKTDSR